MKINKPKKSVEEFLADSLRRMDDSNNSDRFDNIPSISDYFKDKSNLNIEQHFPITVDL